MTNMTTTQSSTVTVAIVSDTHAWLDPRIAEVVKNADIVVHAGDVCDAAVLDELNALGCRVIAVAGNNDHGLVWNDGEAEVATRLPAEARLDLPGGYVMIEHGHLHGMQMPSHDSLRNAHPQARMIVYGHSHLLVCDRDKDPWVVNPGAAGRTRTNGGPSCLILHSSDLEWTLESHRFT